MTVKIAKRMLLLKMESPEISTYEKVQRSPKPAKMDVGDKFTCCKTAKKYKKKPAGRLHKGLGVQPKLKGYAAAVHKLQRRDYDFIIDLCSEEINNPNSAHLLDAYHVRGTFSNELIRKS
ncbi:unnamed protein product [Allacma fusca]|uniref:Uncharacterized protein n=1 Tax=Allacma fusca TaxID=39272 RepID=A0A8J2P9N2_9HEXA|nr:unnamed protein product [Allacma fusca]